MARHSHPAASMTGTGKAHVRPSAIGKAKQNARRRQQVKKKKKARKELQAQLAASRASGRRRSGTYAEFHIRSA